MGIFYYCFAFEYKILIYFHVVNSFLIVKCCQLKCYKNSWHKDWTWSKFPNYNFSRFRIWYCIIAAHEWSVLRQFGIFNESIISGQCSDKKFFLFTTDIVITFKEFRNISSVKFWHGDIAQPLMPLRLLGKCSNY